MNSEFIPFRCKMFTFYYKVSTGQWLHRIDGNRSFSEAEARASVAESFGIPAADIGLGEADITDEYAILLQHAPTWYGVPPVFPTPGPVDDGRLIRPTRRPKGRQEARRERIASLSRQSARTGGDIDELVLLLVDEIATR